MSRTDETYMNMALALARRGLGQVWPNPTVGCIIVSRSAQGREVIVGRGRTGRGGRPHGETAALAEAGERARGATAYVTLEPCAHEGKTPPCAKALIDAGITRVVFAADDPDPRVSGKGKLMLEKANIEVISGVCGTAAQDVNAGFLLKVVKGRPLVTLKVASTLDGRIATHNGQSKWITGEAARARGHLARAVNDAVMVGSTTAILDNPELTCRLPGMEDRSPLRIVCDSRLRLPLTSKLIETAKQRPTWLITLPFQ